MLYEPNNTVKTNPPLNSSSNYYQNGFLGKGKSQESNICNPQGQVQPTKMRPLNVALGIEKRESIT